MVAKIQNVGGKLMLELDPHLLERTGIRAGDDLQVTPSGEGLLLLPMDDLERRRRFEEALEDTNKRYGGMLKRLAE